MTKFLQRLRSISSLSDSEVLKEFENRAKRAQEEIDSIIGICTPEQIPVSFHPPVSSQEAEAVIQNIFDRFHTIACVLRDRKTNPYIIKTEEDAQDLLEALLREHFDDVISEESVPTTAGGTTFIDFLIPRPQIGIEVKIGDVGNVGLRKQINDDIGSYPNHKDCKSLLVLVYDPGSHVKNPRRFETDLSGDTGRLKTRVFVRP